MKIISILFWRIIIWSSFIIYKATKCSEVCGCGQSAFAATNNNAASITAAPVNIVDKKTSWPGQSQKETCLTNYSNYSQPLLVHWGVSYFELEYDLKHSGAWHLRHLYILALAYPSLIVMFLTFYCLNLTVYTPEIALTTVDFPWATWPMVPILRVACLLITCGDDAVRLGIS